MKKIILFLALLIISISISCAQYTNFKENWSEWQPCNCYKGLYFSLWKSWYNQQTGEYCWKIKFRNQFNQQIHFSYTVTKASLTSTKTVLRRSMMPGEIGEPNHFIFADDHVKIWVDNFIFGEDKSAPYAPCGSNTNGTKTDQSNMSSNNQDNDNSSANKNSNQQANSSNQINDHEQQRKIEEQKRRQQQERLNEASRKRGETNQRAMDALGGIFDVLIQNSFKNGIQNENIQRQNEFGRLQELVSARNGTLSNCSHCSGQGYESCSSCSGSGKKTCMGCYGKGISNCTLCYGSGSFLGKTCGSCGGKGGFQCTICKSSGHSYCTSCYATGNDFCTYCSGTGQVFKEE